MKLDESKLYTKEQTLEMVNLKGNAAALIGYGSELKLWASIIYWIEKQEGGD